ncbi:MAG: 1-acyl-sn-glycerol-3-phosphate acyltransferase [Anaeroplasmataceae bacterium]|nr:1-acyl-sn-glycerol-3-phosphate acyltransferase [Anaeroplasmataceae bacterium]
MKNKVIEFADEQNDDFSGIHRLPFSIDATYSYKRGIIWRAISFLLYYGIMRILAYLYMKLWLGFRVVNRKCLKKYKNTGYFLYANHTHAPADGFMPSLITFPKRVYVLVCSENLSKWGTKNFMAMIGAVPIPNQYSGMRAFKSYLKELLQKKKVIMIYPEAHIWPYYTKIRSFPSVSFTYPVVEEKPVFTFTTTYQKGWIRTRITAYVDGPFYARKDIDKKEAIEELRNKIYEVMIQRSKNSTYEKIKYKKKEQNTK